MTKYLAGVLSVIAVGVLLIAYGLIVPRSASVGTTAVPPTFTTEQMTMMRDSSYAAGANARVAPAPYPTSYQPQPSVGSGYMPIANQYAANPYQNMQRYAVVDDRGPAQFVSIDAPIQRQIVRMAVRTPVRRSVQQPRRSWQKTAAVIGGSSAAAAGLGAIFGGKKGALIGAAIGGGASTLFEVTRDR